MSHSIEIIYYSEEDCLKLLNRKPPRLPEFDRWNLFYAVTACKVKVVELLLNRGARITLQTLRFSFYSNNKFLINLLLSHTPEDLKRECTELCVEAVTSSNFKMNLKLLVKNGFNIDSSVLGESVLTGAIKEEKLELIDVLLLYGADPCQQYLSENVQTSSISFALSLPCSNIENIIKYAALYVENKDSKHFFDNVGLRAYSKFALRCMLEIRSLKMLFLNPKKQNLYDFLISQGNLQKLYLGNQVMLNFVFHYLGTTSLPIYRIAILKKIPKRDLFNNFAQVSYLRCVVNCENKELILNSDCILNICKFLIKKDLISFWVALKVK